MCRICDEFNIIAERALKQPETSEELMDMMNFIGNARSMGMIKLNEKIKVSNNYARYTERSGASDTLSNGNIVSVCSGVLRSLRHT